MAKKAVCIAIAVSFMAAQVAYPELQYVGSENDQKKIASGMSVEQAIAAQQNATAAVEMMNALESPLVIQREAPIMQASHLGSQSVFFISNVL
ncbi:MAG: hypothetical protein NC938_04580 [Candidatus Omnitrophica bacterium]|nr:hypothetical protein [Candidatus Omnitrophota bacterium]